MYAKIIRFTMNEHFRFSYFLFCSFFNHKIVTWSYFFWKFHLILMGKIEESLECIWAFLFDEMAIKNCWWKYGNISVFQAKVVFCSSEFSVKVFENFFCLQKYIDKKLIIKRHSKWPHNFQTPFNCNTKKQDSCSAINVYINH